MPLWDDAELRSDLDEIRTEREISITVYRLGIPLSPQPVRVAKMTNNAVKEENDDATDSHMKIVILGTASTDIQAQDEFGYESELYRVTAVRPHRSIVVRAEAERIE